MKKMKRLKFLLTIEEESMEMQVEAPPCSLEMKN